MDKIGRESRNNSGENFAGQQRVQCLFILGLGRLFCHYLSLRSNNLHARPKTKLQLNKLTMDAKVEVE